MWNCAAYHAAVLGAQVRCFGRGGTWLPQPVPDGSSSAAAAGLGCAALCQYIFVETKVCSVFCRAAITSVSEPSCCLWSAHHHCAPPGQEDVVPCGQGIKEAQRDVKLDFNGYFCVSICGDISGGGFQTSCLHSLDPVCCYKFGPEWHRVGSSWMGPWMFVSPVSEQNSRVCLAGVDVGWWGKRGMCSPEKQGVR